MLHTYYELTKPRLMIMNIIVAMAAFVFAAPTQFDWRSFFYMSLGLAGVIASACVFNNIADRRLDTRMERTKNRALASGRVSPLSATLYAMLLLTGGILFLYQTDILALHAALVGFVVYVFIYTPLKPRSPAALFVGAVAGATPPLVGYAAAAHTLDLYAWGLFFILFLWQVPHFLAIARFRFEEYAAAGVPLLVKKSPSEQGRRNARRIFYFSLIFLLVYCFVLILHRWMR